MSLITVNVSGVKPAYCICSSAYSSVFSRITHVLLLKTQPCDCNLFCLPSQDPLLDGNPPDFILVDEPHIMLATNSEDRRVHDIESSPSNRMLDENIVKKSAADTAFYIVVNTTSPDSLTQTSEVKSHNVTSPTDENIVLMASKGHWETNSLLRNNEEERHSSLQHRKSLPPVPADGTGNIVYGSDQKLYRINKGASGPIGPQGRRVSIFGMELIRHALVQGPSFYTSLVLPSNGIQNLEIQS